MQVRGYNVGVKGKKYVVYLHVNKINKKRYVGITCQKPIYRWRSDGSGYFRSPFFYNAIQKYGWENFDHFILKDNLSFEQAKELEKLYIHTFKTKDKNFGYNMTEGGDGSCGRKMPKEHLKKLVALHKGKPLSKEHREKIRKANLGKKASDETRRKLSLSHMGYKPTQKQLEALRNRVPTNRKAIYGIDENGVRHDFKSIHEASKILNLKSLDKNFKRIVQSQHRCGGMIWYYNEMEVSA